MTTIDWGSVADWVSGIGSMAAAGIAVWIALSERGRNRRDRMEADRREAAIENDMFLEALFLWKRLGSAAEGLRQAHTGGADYGADKTEWFLETTAIRETALRLQQLPKITVRNYREFEGLIQFMRMPAFRKGFHIVEFADASPMIKHACEHAVKRVTEMANPLAPFTW